MQQLALLFLAFLFFANSLFSKEIEILSFKEFQQKIENQQSQTVVYNFWATWCKPCVEELPYFEKLNSEYGSDSLNVVLVNLDFKSQYKRKLIPFVEKNEIQSEVILLDAPDYNSWLNKISPKWSGAIPATLVVNHLEDKWDFYEKSFTYQELLEILQLKPKQ